MEAPSETEPAVADDAIPETEPAVAADGSGEQIEPLSEKQAEAAHRVKTVRAALETTLDILRNMGVVKSVQVTEKEIGKQRRLERDLVREFARSHGNVHAIAQG